MLAYASKCRKMDICCSKIIFLKFVAGACPDPLGGRGAFPIMYPAAKSLCPPVKNLNESPECQREICLEMGTISSASMAGLRLRSPEDLSYREFTVLEN